MNNNNNNEKEHRHHYCSLTALQQHARPRRSNTRCLTQQAQRSTTRICSMPNIIIAVEISILNGPTVVGDVASNVALMKYLGAALETRPGTLSYAMHHSLTLTPRH
jgi:hypothetical protein